MSVIAADTDLWQPDFKDREDNSQKMHHVKLVDLLYKCCEEEEGRRRERTGEERRVEEGPRAWARPGASAAPPPPARSSCRACAGSSPSAAASLPCPPTSTAPRARKTVRTPSPSERWIRIQHSRRLICAP